jgi:hypothetical protein
MAFVMKKVLGDRCRGKENISNLAKVTKIKSFKVVLLLRISELQ